VRRCDNAALLKLDLVAACKAGVLVVSVDALVGVVFLLFGGHGPCERALELHQVTPIDMRPFGRHSASAHPTNVVHHLRACNQHLLGITTTQSAGSAKRSIVNHRNPFAGCGHPIGCDHRGGAAANDREVI